MSTSWATAARQVPGLDLDPCPGDAPGVRRLAGGLRERAAQLADAARSCRGWEPVGWTGPAAEDARAALEALGDRLGLLQRSFDDAATALDGWAGELDGLQAEAAALGEEALENRRRRLEASVRVTTVTTVAGGAVLGGVVLGGVALGDDLVLARLEAERRAVQHRAEELHSRWLATARHRGAVVDAAAPPSRSGAWRGGWDRAHDSYQSQVRQHARVMAWGADALGAAAAVSGLLALAPPATAVAAPLSVGLGLASTQLNAQLALGADGSGDAVLWGVATLGVGAVAGGVLRAAGRAGSTVPRAGVVAGHAGEKGALAVDVGQAVGPVLGRDGAVRPPTVTDLDGHGVPVTVHDIEEPWQVGHGLRGAGFAGVATVPVPTPPPGGAPGTAPVLTRTSQPDRQAPAAGRPVRGRHREEG